MNCAACGDALDPNARFCPACGRPVFHSASAPAPSQFIRPREGRMIAGVCAGIAMHYRWDVSVVRLVLAFCVLFAGLPLVVYAIAWVVMPNGEYTLPPTTGTVAS